MPDCYRIVSGLESSVPLDTIVRHAIVNEWTMRHALSFANCALVDAIAKNEKKQFESKGTLTATLTTFLRQKLRTEAERPPSRGK